MQSSHKLLLKVPFRQFSHSSRLLLPRVQRATPFGRLRAPPVAPSDRPWYALSPNERRPQEDVSKPQVHSQPIDEYLHPLHAFMTDSPLFNQGTLRFIDMRPSPESPSPTLTDWVVIATLNSGRERAIVPAAGSVADFIKTDISWPANAEPEEIKIEGIQSSEPVWAMVDAGTVAVHVMNAEARSYYDFDSWL